MGTSLQSRAAGKRSSSPLLPLADQAYLAIKEEILNNRLVPGALLPVDRFLRQMKLSRTPVREAILRLQREGFVEVRPRMGTIVAHLDLRRLREMYHVRGVLEGEAARLAATLIPEELLAEVCLELERSQKLSGAVRMEAMSEAGQRLHQAIVNHCGNTVLIQTIQSLQDHFIRFRHVSLRIPEKVLSSHREHLGIVDAFKKQDGALAEQRLRQHFEHAARSLIDALLNHPTGRDLEVVPLRTAR